ncbi:hypothetical protein PSQ90_09825 [Devosia rhodophyticola]|uniref:Motility protein n=1 Tax=Devosia rhodophyticola TaxID=3026423 RepID=A0ABY7YTG1_9HYPH|nr:hypothetical protein [Devosia rhodophyticola]WDR04628.1 hypothetical protein PSQ90_09825 [Devosia rhodophyticola]
MDTDLTMQMVAMSNGSSRANVQQAVLKKSLELDQATANMVAEVSRAAPPAGQGLKIDKLA